MSHTTASDKLIDDLRGDIAERRVVVIVGAGVSMSVTDGNPVASWPGLLLNGAKRCEDLARESLPLRWGRLVREEIGSNDLHDLLAAAYKIEEKLKEFGGEYYGWLDDTVGQLQLLKPDVISALHRLNVPLATTNYDNLLESETGRPAVTWRQHHLVEQVLQGDKPGIIHLHGHVSDPDSIVLGPQSYEKVMSDDHAQAMLRALRSMRTLLFVGYGKGLKDPNFGAFLRWSSNVLSNSRYRHYRLALEAECHVLQQEHHSQERIFVCPYGQTYDDLAPFLNSLTKGELREESDTKGVEGNGSEASEIGLSPPPQGEGSAVAVTSGTVPIELRIDRPFSEYSDDKQEHLLAAIKRLLQTDAELRVIGKRRGSVRLTVDGLDSAEAERLYWLIQQGELDAYGVTGMDMLDAYGVTGMDMLEPFNAAIAGFVEQLTDIEREVRDHKIPVSRDHLDRLTAAANEILGACLRFELEIGSDLEQLRNAQQAYRHTIAPWFDQSWFMERAKTKPKGYPGDFVLYSGIYDGRSKSTGIGAYLDRYFLETDVARSAVGRMRAIRQFLVDELAQREGEVSILNIACGPCREFVNGLEHPPSVRPMITVVDSDQETLDWVEQNVSGVDGAPELHCVRHNALRIGSAKRNIQTFGRPDIIYSIGLFDYIPDRLLVPMLRGLRETLADGGVLYLAFMDADRYDKTILQWMQDWFFFQRSVNDCRELFEQAGFDVDAMEMTRDETGITVNLISRSPSDNRYRVDGAQTTAEPQAEPEHLPGIDGSRGYDA